MFFHTLTLSKKLPIAYLPNSLLESQGILVEQFRSESFGDRDKLKPIFFIGEKSVLILAEKNYMGFHGIEAFDFKYNQINYLGNLDLAYRVGGGDSFYYEANPLKLHYKANPSEKVKIIFLNNSYQIELKGEFYENFESSGGRKISSKNSTVIYELDQKGFRLLEVKGSKK